MIVQSDSIDRYNDDFSLYVPSVGSRYADTNFTGVGVIDDSLDWSISFFCYRETRSTGVIWDSRGGVASNQPKGVELIFDESNPDYSFRFRTGLGSSQTDYYFSDYKYKLGNIHHTVLTFNSTTKDLTQYVNSVKVQTLNTTGDNPIDCTTVTYSRFLSFSGSYAGALKQCFIRDFSVYSKEVNPQEISYIYEAGVPPVSAYANIQHYYPLNQVPYESGGNYFMNDVANLYNPNATTSDVQLIGWTTDELGLGVDGIQTQTTYKGWGNKKDYRRNSLAFTTSATGIVNNDMSTISIAGDWTFTFRINPYLRPYGPTGPKYVFWSGTSNVDLFAIRLEITGSFFQAIDGEFVYSSGGSNTVFNLFRYDDADLSFGNIIKRDVCCSLRKTGDNIDVFVQGVKVSTEPIPVSTFNNLSNAVAIFGRNNNSSHVQNVGISHISLCKDILTDSDMLDIYNKDYSSLVTTDFEYYPSDSTSKKIIDVSGNGLDYTYTSNDKIEISSDTAKPNDYTKGLNFNSSKQQYLEVTGLEAFDISEGYTTVLGWQRVDNVLPSSPETMMGSDEANGNYTIQFIQNSRDLGLYHYSGFVAESGISLDLSNRNLTTFISGSAREITNAYSSVKDTRQGYRNGKITCSDDSITTLLGFDIIFSSGAKMYLGRRNSSGRYYTGKLSYCTIVKGRLTQEQIKTIYNNGLYRSVYEVIEDTSKVMLDVDFINPFLDGSDVKFPDNSGNCVVTAKQNTGTDWTTLGGVQASID